jgi:quercetin dioxygenase-like cupin family protein
MNSWDLSAYDLQPKHPEVLLSQEGASRGIAALLSAGDLWQDHETREAAWLVVVQGEVEVEHDGQTQRAGVGHVFHFAEHERREVRAVADARLLMVLAPYPAPDHQTASNPKAG